MSLPSLRPLLFHHESSPKLLPLPIPRSNFHRKPAALNIRSHFGSPKRAVPRWENALATAASLYPLYVTIGGSVAVVNPSAFSWFVARGPVSYTCALAFIMLAMGLTLELRDLFGLFRKQPFSIFCGCVARYTIMPSLGAIVSKTLGLKPYLAVGLILLGCCPGGTASNVVSCSFNIWLRRKTTESNCNSGRHAKLNLGRRTGNLTFWIPAGRFASCAISHYYEHHW